MYNTKKSTKSTHHDRTLGNNAAPCSLVAVLHVSNSSVTPASAPRGLVIDVCTRRPPAAFTLTFTTTTLPETPLSRHSTDARSTPSAETHVRPSRAGRPPLLAPAPARRPPVRRRISILDICPAKQWTRASSVEYGCSGGIHVCDSGRAQPAHYSHGGVYYYWR